MAEGRTRARSSSSIASTGKRLLGFFQVRHSDSKAFRCRAETCSLFQDVAETSDVPAVGGIQVETSDLVAFPILPPYVALFEPTEEDIWLAPKMRAIFLNQPLQPWEHEVLSRFKSLVLTDLGLPQDAPVPRWLRPHMTRVLQQSKYKAEEAVKTCRAIYRERVKCLPIRYADVKDDLATGVVYWHGRDLSARPLMVISAERTLPLMGRPEAVKKLFLFHMEFALRHLLVPGRVECWAVMLDCAGMDKLPLWKAKDLVQVLGSMLNKIYPGRMVWLRLFNFPTSFVARALQTFIESFVSTLGKADKVSFVRTAEKRTWFSELVAPGQLEQRFGGSAPDVPASAVYPYRMFATPEGYSNDEVEGTNAASSVHLLTNVAFREGMIWADCLDSESTSAVNWREEAANLPLPSKAAECVGASPCQDMMAWESRMQSRMNLSLRKDSYDEENDTPTECFSIAGADDCDYEKVFSI
eukprot:TRINITY_DN2680_c1_g1_i3.p1 TRINITY_DN2680_c1_g1~~TRINITY_DN2680_c1_g1_i3.p1  ORF type:complete len:470 (+),score=74.48 TRINITY_DN2680_c1_g1_i3:43-1452(+)